MRTIGIRVSPKAMHFAIFDSTKKKIINIESLLIPNALSIPEALKYVRNHLLDILREFEIQKAAVRTTEPSAKRPCLFRIEIEGVIKETFASSDLESYAIGQISTISSWLKIPRADFKKYIDGELTYPVENWKGLSKEQKESVLSAIGVVNV